MARTKKKCAPGHLFPGSLNAKLTNIWPGSAGTPGCIKSKTGRHGAIARPEVNEGWLMSGSVGRSWPWPPCGCSRAPVVRLVVDVPKFCGRKKNTYVTLWRLPYLCLNWQRRAALKLAEAGSSPHGPGQSATQKGMRHFFTNTAPPTAHKHKSKRNAPVMAHTLLAEHQ